MLIKDRINEIARSQRYRINIVMLRNRNGDEPLRWSAGLEVLPEANTYNGDWQEVLAGEVATSPNEALDKLLVMDVGAMVRFD